jgi:sugar phosphate isomerase/epimerase
MIRTSRRRFLQGACALGAVSPLAACMSPEPQANAQPSPKSPAKAFFARNNLPIGIQLYTLGDLVRTDMAGTLKQVSAAGYRSVELAGYYGKTPKELRAAFDAAGLKCTSAHIGLQKGTDAEPKLLDDLGRVAADAHVIGATHVIAPALAAPADIKLSSPPPPGAAGLAKVAQAMTQSHWKALATQLNAIGAKMKAEGLGFGYHNHNVEFFPAAGTTGFEILMKETDPKLVTFELDIGWAAAAGLDPIAVFAKHSGRFGLAHLKDIKASTVPNYEFKMDPTEVGSGKLDWPKILPAAYRAGVRKFFVEQEAPFEHGRLEAAAISFKYLDKVEA